MTEGEPRLTEAQLKALRIGAENNIRHWSGDSSVPVPYWQGVFDTLGLIVSAETPEERFSSPYRRALDRLAEEVFDNLTLPPNERYEGFRNL